MRGIPLALAVIGIVFPQLILVHWHLEIGIIIPTLKVAQSVQRNRVTINIEDASEIGCQWRMQE